MPVPHRHTQRSMAARRSRSGDAKPPSSPHSKGLWREDLPFRRPAQRRDCTGSTGLVARSGTASGWSRGNSPSPPADPRHRRLLPRPVEVDLSLFSAPSGTAPPAVRVDGGQHRAPGLPGVPARRQLEAYQLAHGRPGAGHAGEPVPDHPAQRAALSAGWGVLLRSLPGLEGAGGGPGGTGLRPFRPVWRRGGLLPLPPPLPPLRSHDRLLRGGRRGRPALLSGGLPLPGPAGPRGDVAPPRGRPFSPPASPPTRPPSPAPPI